MAREKKSMIGVDPLAWLDKEKQPEQVEDATGDLQTKDSSGKPEKKTKTRRVNVSGHSIDETSLLKGHDISKDRMGEVVDVFYNDLFEMHPETSALFSNTDKTEQRDKLISALELLITNLHDEDVLLSTLTQLGERHQQYGVTSDLYPVVVEALVASFKKVIGRHWTKAVSKAWIELLTAASEVMCSAYKSEVGMQEKEETEPTVTDLLTDDLQTDEVATLHLHGVQDISKSQALKNEILAMINDHDQINIEASDVERIDGTALQLLCALFVYAKENNLLITWLSPSDQLIESAKISGVEAMLELN